MPAEFDPLRLLALLLDEGVDFIVVGGIAAVFHGSPVSTSDLDLLYDASPRNLDRLLEVLSQVGAVYRDPAGRQVVPDREKLATFQVNLLQSDHGPLDLLRSVGAGLGYRELVARTEVYEVEGLRVPVLDLETIIAVKEDAGRPKDRGALPFLREILDRRRGDS